MDFNNKPEKIILVITNDNSCIFIRYGVIERGVGYSKAKCPLGVILTVVSEYDVL